MGQTGERVGAAEAGLDQADLEEAAAVVPRVAGHGVSPVDDRGDASAVGEHVPWVEVAVDQSGRVRPPQEAGDGGRVGEGRLVDQAGVGELRERRRFLQRRRPVRRATQLPTVHAQRTATVHLDRVHLRQLLAEETEVGIRHRLALGCGQDDDGRPTKRSAGFDDGCGHVAPREQLEHGHFHRHRLGGADLDERGAASVAGLVHRVAGVTRETHADLDRPPEDLLDEHA
jgi:hypothetical protein